MERAQAAFHKKEIQAREGATAMAEYKAAGNAERAKTERLRALRSPRKQPTARPRQLRQLRRQNQWQRAKRRKSQSNRAVNRV